MCKQALWLAPAPPACTPIHHNHNAINYYKQQVDSDESEVYDIRNVFS